MQAWLHRFQSNFQPKAPQPAHAPSRRLPVPTQRFASGIGLLSLLATLPAPAPALAKGTAEHVVVVVFDGMRPDFITPQFCPNLYSLATNGVFFRKNHCVFVSTTIVNGTALATGSNPGRSGILANSDYRQHLNYTTSIASEVLDSVRRADMTLDGKYIAVDTLAEIIQDAGFHTYITGTKGVALMHDRSPRKTDTAAHSNSIVLARGLTLPRAAGDPLKKVNDDKVFPDTFTSPNSASDGWTTRALVHGLWKKGLPKYSLLWLSDPDVTQHSDGPGSAKALSAIESSDKNLGEVIKVLKEKKLWEKTDLMVVSDHGFSTVEKSADVALALRNRGVNAHSKIDNPERGDVVVVAIGGSALLYAIDRDPATIQKTAEILQTSDFTGVLFSREPVEGALSFESVGYHPGPHAPDLILSMRWNEKPSDVNVPGLLIATSGSKNQGHHGSLSRFEMNNTLVATGPDFKRGWISEIPSGNIDLAPTILHILGIPQKGKMDGRVLVEALADYSGPLPEPRELRLEKSRQLGFMHWSQYLKVWEVNGTRYFPEGNGKLEFR